MKKLIFFMGLSLVIPAGAFAQQPRVSWRCDKVTQLIFPADIVKFRAGYTSDDAVSQSDGRVLYIQPVDVLPESNLNVITADGRYYAFDVFYDTAATAVNYIIEPSMAFYREACESSVDEHSAQADTEVSDVPMPSAPSSSPLPARIWGRVRSMPEYLRVNNVARLQKLAIILNGVYADAEYVYFRFCLENGSNVPFDVDYIAFSIGAKKSKKTSTQERVQLYPVDSDKSIRRVDAKSRCEVIYCFEKFTIGKDKVLLAEVLEAGGDRNIVLPVPEHFIIEARHL